MVSREGDRDSSANQRPAISISLLEAVDVPGVFSGIFAVYRDTFSQPPYYRTEADARDFAESFQRHATFAGFRLVAARMEPDNAIVGFTYGYTAAPGQGWYEQVAPLLPPESAFTSLIGAFLLTQLAVLPAYQGREIGGRLHHTLLTTLPHRCAVLSTRRGDSPARHLYRRRGWTTLVDDVAFPGADHPYLVLVRESLPGALTNSPRKRGKQH